MKTDTKKRIDLPAYTLWISFAVIVFGIVYYRPSPFSFIPLLITQIIMRLQSKVNRFAFLLGAINAVFYTIAYTRQTLYSAALYALVISMPLQLITFFNWSKNTVGKKTELKELSMRNRFLIFGGMAVGWLILFLFFSKLGSRYLLLDNSLTITGIISTILCTLRFKEYTFLQIVSSSISFVTYVLMLKEDPSSIMWLASVTHTLVCVSYAWINMNKKEETT